MRIHDIIDDVLMRYLASCFNQRGLVKSPIGRPGGTPTRTAGPFNAPHGYQQPTYDEDPTGADLDRDPWIPSD